MPPAPDNPNVPTSLPQSGADPPPASEPAGQHAALAAGSAPAMPMAEFDLPPQPGPVKVTVTAEPGTGDVVIRVGAGASPDGVQAKPAIPPGARARGEGGEVQTMFAEILRKVTAVAQGDYEFKQEIAQLRQENDELRRMQDKGLFDFVLKVKPEDFHAFAVVIALGHRRAASKFLKVQQRTFYARLSRWRSGDVNYQKMLRWIEWRKAVGRKIKLRLPDPNDSGAPDETAANPAVLHELLEKIRDRDNRDYPAVLRQILEVLMTMNPGNWQSACRELVDLIRDELLQ